MQVKAKKTYPQLKEIFVEGDILEITPKVYEEDTRLVNDIYGGFDKNGNLLGIVNGFRLPKGELPDNIKKIFDAVIAPKGSMKDLRVTNGKGDTYLLSTLRNFIGRKDDITDMFEKLN